MTADKDRPLKGQMDVYDCIRVAKKNLDGVRSDPTPGDEPPTILGVPRPLTAAEVVALRLKENPE